MQTLRISPYDMGPAMTSVRLKAHTPRAEEFMAYVARVSNPSNQENAKYERLLAYCIKHKHWSVFEQAHMTLEIVTTLSVATQILRHRSFCFQQLSRRYAGEDQAPVRYKTPELRQQDPRNRQSSGSVIAKPAQEEWGARIEAHLRSAVNLYSELLAAGVAKECARAVLPQSVLTTLYMTGNCRSWIHYISLRSRPETQKEHRLIADHCKEIFRSVFPYCSLALDSLNWMP